MNVVLLACASGFLALSLSGCGGGGGDTPAQPPENVAAVPPPAVPAPDPIPQVPAPAPGTNQQIEATSSYAIAQANARSALMDWRRAPGLVGGTMLTARAVADLNGDGFPDAVVAAGRFLELNASTPLSILKGTANSGGVPLAVPETSWIAGTAPNVNHARKVLLADWNGDGIKDVFVCAHGYDAPLPPDNEWPGTTNSLLLSAGGRWQVSSQPWSTFVGFSHGCASGDVRNNSRQDIFVANSQGQGSYWLVNDGAGNFVKTSEGLPASIAKAKPLFSSEILDLDSDGFLDLVVGGTEGPNAWDQPTVIFWGEGTGRFSDGRSTVVPAVPGWPNVLIFSAADLDGDGTRELTIMRTKGNVGDADFYRGYYAQVLKRSGRQLSDVSGTWSSVLNSSAPTVITNFQGTPGWIEWTWALDYDKDGKIDLVGSDGYTGAYWSKNTGTHFLPWQKLF